MTLQASLYAHLAADGDVSNLAEARIYPVLAPQVEDALPGPTIVYWFAGIEPDEDLDGDEILDVTTWGFLCLAADYDAAHELYEALSRSLRGFSGQFGGDDGVEVQNIAPLSASDSETVLQFGLYGVESQFSITRAA